MSLSSGSRLLVISPSPSPLLCPLPPATQTKRKHRAHLPTRLEWGIFRSNSRCVSHDLNLYRLPQQVVWLFFGDEISDSLCTASDGSQHTSQLGCPVNMMMKGRKGWEEGNEVRGQRAEHAGRTTKRKWRGEKCFVKGWAVTERQKKKKGERKDKVRWGELGIDGDSGWWSCSVSLGTSCLSLQFHFLDSACSLVLPHG